MDSTVSLVVFASAKTTTWSQELTGVNKSTTDKSKTDAPQQQPNPHSGDDDEQLDESFRKFGRAAPLISARLMPKKKKWLPILGVPIRGLANYSGLPGFLFRSGFWQRNGSAV